MKTLSLALRNLLRNQRRSLTTLLAMSIGLVAILVFGGYRANISYGTETGLVQAWGHLEIQHKDYFREGSDNPSAYGIADYEQIMQTLQNDPVLAPMLTMVTPSLQLGGLAGNFSAGISRSVMAMGVVVPSYNQMLTWNDYGIISYAKPLPLQGTQPDAVVLGEGVARKLALCEALKVPDCKPSSTHPSTAQGSAIPKDIAALSELEASAVPKENGTRIELLASTAHGAPNVASLNVVQAKNMGIKAIDDRYMAMHLAQAQKLIYGSSPPQVTAIMLQLKHTAQIPVARARVNLLLASSFKDQALEVLDFVDLNPMYPQTMQFMDSMFGFIATLLGVIVLFTIGNTMSTAVVERTVEIGTLRAMGLNRSGLRRLFVSEGLLLGITGSILGVAIASGVAYLINHSGLSWTPPGYSYSYRILILLGQDPKLMVGCVIGLILVTLISAWLPANRASKMVIVDALRHV
jgi:putative ABC transport system permease protein